MLVMTKRLAKMVVVLPLSSRVMPYSLAHYEIIGAITFTGFVMTGYVYLVKLVK